MKLFVQLGRLGDVINLLPLARYLASRGERVGIMASRPYVDVLDGVSYVRKVAFDGEPNELREAVDKARIVAEDGSPSDVIVTQVTGPTRMVEILAYSQVQPPHAITESFAKEAWRLAGHLKLWEHKLPLVFNQRDKKREAEFIPAGRKPIALVSTGGISSPFPYSDLLLELVRLRFPKWNLIDISELKAERFYDLLGLYEKAKVLIATDSAPLHLAYAVPNLPVCAIISDRPNLWHGAVWRENHIFHCRYRDFPERAVEMLNAIEAVDRHTWFNRGPSPRIIHAVSQYDRRSMKHSEPTWEAEYQNGKWIECPVEVGSCGRDSGQLKNGQGHADPNRFPYLRDVIRNACLRSEAPSDIICLTRQDTCFKPGLTNLILDKTPCFAHRVEAGNYHPAIDLFAFTRKWWMENRASIPDLIVGKDAHWQRVLLAALKQSGATELPMGSVYAEVEKKEVK